MLRFSSIVSTDPITQFGWTICILYHTYITTIVILHKISDTWSWNHFPHLCNQLDTLQRNIFKTTPIHSNCSIELQKYTILVALKPIEKTTADLKPLHKQSGWETSRLYIKYLWNRPGQELSRWVWIIRAGKEHPGAV